MCDPIHIERGVRQLLSDKISGNLLGLFLLVPEYLRLGIWDLLCGWTHSSGADVYPRVAFQLVNESALCVTGKRESRCLSQKGFEVVNGLPFVASDSAVHTLLDAHTVAETQELQIALGKIRKARGHYAGKLLALDPHRIESYTKRLMRKHKKSDDAKPMKMAQTFFCIDAETEQPVGFIMGSAAMTVTQITPALLQLTDTILQTKPKEALVMVDAEHYSVRLIEHVLNKTPFDILLPMPHTRSGQNEMKNISDTQFTPQWAGYATANLPFRFKNSDIENLYQLVQRFGETKETYAFNRFMTTRSSDTCTNLTRNFPQRWHIEEFFNKWQDIGWQRAGTLNMNIRYGQMTMALIAQAALYQVKKRLGEPVNSWDAKHFAVEFLAGLDGDVRVCNDTIVVTYYNAPNSEKLKNEFGNISEKLIAEGVNPHIPWLYNYKLDFRFK